MSQSQRPSRDPIDEFIRRNSPFGNAPTDPSPPDQGTATPAPSMDQHSLDRLLQEHNPFTKPPAVTTHDIWEGIPDLETLNKSVSDEIFQRLEDIKQKKYPWYSLLVNAQGEGTGKSHLIGRVRKRVQQENAGFFILVNRLSDLNDPNGSFQELLSQSLAHPSNQEHTSHPGNPNPLQISQWQEIAAAMVNDLVGKKATPNQWIQHFEDLGLKSIVETSDKVISQYQKQRNIKDLDVVRAIFLTLLDSEAPHLYKWLSGQEIAGYKADQLHLPTKAGQSFSVVLEILKIIGFYKELVICFDELDTNDFNDAGFHTSVVVVNLIKNLVQNLDRGLILTVMQASTWTERVLKTVSVAVYSKTKVDKDPLRLQPLNAKTAVEVAQFFLGQFYGDRQVIPPHPLYPLSLEDVEQVGKNKPTIREFLRWCRDKVHGAVHQSDRSSGVNQTSEAEIAFKAELAAVNPGQIDNNGIVGAALLYSFENLKGYTLENVTIQDITTKVKNNKKDNYINFKIIGTDRGQPAIIGVAVIQNEGGKSLAVGLKRLLQKEEYGLTRGCLVRDLRKPISKHNKATYIDPLVSPEQGGEFVDLKEIEIKPLLALEAVYRKRETDYGLTEEQIQDFVAHHGETYQLGVHNQLIQEILSDPSYECPDLVAEPEPDRPETQGNNATSQSSNLDTIFGLP
jgi:uncharacterized protein (UPF0248 family)